MDVRTDLRLDQKLDRVFTYPKSDVRYGREIEKSQSTDRENNIMNGDIKSKLKEDRKIVDEMLTKFEKGLERLKDIFKGELKFEVNDEADMVVVKVLDTEGEVIRQIPSEGVVKLAENLNEMLGVLFDEKA